MKKSKIFFITLLFLIFYTRAVCQIEKYVIDNTKEINSADINDTSFADLQQLGQAIDDKRLVMLGEFHHGDGETFKLKSRIVRFLHERKGFDVIVFESDFFTLNETFNLFKKGDISYDSLVFLSIYPVWTQCLQTHKLFRYLAETSLGLHGNEMILSGMDNRLHSPYSQKNIGSRIDSFLRQVQIPFVHTPEYYFFKSKIVPAWKGDDPNLLDSLIKILPKIIDQVNAKKSIATISNSEIDFYIHVFNGLLYNYKRLLYYHSDDFKRHKKDYPLIDFQMAENLKWLVNNKYANKKIIVWAHNGHIEPQLEDSSYMDYKSMGYYLSKDTLLSKQTYTLGVTCYEGSAKLVGRKLEQSTKIKKNSIESWMHTKNFNFGFVNLKNLEFPQIKPFYMRTYIHSDYEQDWTKIYDGVLYIRNAKPCISKSIISK